MGITYGYGGLRHRPLFVAQKMFLLPKAYESPAPYSTVIRLCFFEGLAFEIMSGDTGSRPECQ